MALCFAFRTWLSWTSSSGDFTHCFQIPVSWQTKLEQNKKPFIQLLKSLQAFSSTNFRLSEMGKVYHRKRNLQPQPIPTSRRLLFPPPAVDILPPFILCHLAPWSRITHELPSHFSTFIRIQHYFLQGFFFPSFNFFPYFWLVQQLCKRPIQLIASWILETCDSEDVHIHLTSVPQTHHSILDLVNLLEALHFWSCRL